MNDPLDIPRFEDKLCKLINSIYRNSFFEDRVYYMEFNIILDNHSLHTIKCSNSHVLYFQLKNDLDLFYSSKRDHQMKHVSWDNVNKIDLVEFFLDFAKKHNLSLNHVNEEVLNIIILK